MAHFTTEKYASVICYTMSKDVAPEGLGGLEPPGRSPAPWVPQMKWHFVQLHTVVWNDYLLIFWPNVIFYYTRSWKPNANNQICWITKVSTHSKTLIQFCWKFIYFKDVYWWFLKIWICDKMRALFIFQIIDYAWISIMLFDLCWKW